jgi:hypothetical protein
VFESRVFGDMSPKFTLSLLNWVANVAGSAAVTPSRV